MDKIQKRIYKTEVLARSVERMTREEKAETDAAKKERMARLEADPEKWFAYYFRKYATSQPAAFHKAATKRIMANPEWYEVRMWSRELAKTTRTMMEVLYLTLVGYPHTTPPNSKLPITNSSKKRYVLLISNSLDNACRLLLPYRLCLEKNEYLIHDYGVQKKPGSWKAAEFTTKQGIAFRALGAGQSPRGTRNEEVRPDVILFDDVDTDADCLNPQLIAKKWRWIEEAAISTRSVSIPLLVIFCGNRIAIDCCVERATKYASYTDIVNIADAQGNSSWPQKNNRKDIEQVLKQKSYAAQQKEYFNNPIIEGSVFKAMAYKTAWPINYYSLLVCYTDPSFKDSNKNDFKATVLVGKWEDEFHVIKCFLAQTSTADMVNWHYDIMDLVGRKPCYYFIEHTVMQDVIMKAFSDIAKVRGKNIPLMADKRAKKDKFTRIESVLAPLHTNGKLYLNEKEKDNPHMQRLEEQFRAIAPKSRAHDDGPDAVEGAVWTLNEKSAILQPGSFISLKSQPNKNSF